LGYEEGGKGGMKYTVEDLVKIFSEHMISAQNHQKKLISDFIENNPGDPIPENLTDSFNLALALKCMCEEIVRLKDAD
jgi:hypothetical protein